MSRTYAGIPLKYGQLDFAKTVLIPVPYDGTSTWQKGADKGPSAFFEASDNMELYDIETNTEVYKKGIYLAKDVLEKTSPELMVKAVFEQCKKYLKLNKLVTLVGGEHSISIGAIDAFVQKYEHLTVVQLDAHADLRKTYKGSTCNHACAMYKANNTTNLLQVGIRSMDVSEAKEMKMDNVYFAHKIRLDNNWMEKAISQIKENVYISIDLDVFDPSILPSTGTPEPGGLLWYETLEFLQKIVKYKNVVGFDIVELCPNKLDKSSNFLAAKLYYKLLSYIYKDD